jgi:uncharacterized damage-inducible protein DinB
MFTSAGMLQFHSWTHNALGAMLEHAGRLSADELRKPLDGFGWPTVHSQLVHIAEAEDFWVAASQGVKDYAWWPKRDDWWDYAGYDTTAEIEAKLRQIAAGTRAFFKRLSDQEVIQPRVVTFPGGSSIEITPAKMLTHVLTHAFHHKGQIAAMCRLLGYPPPETDLA